MSNMSKSPVDRVIPYCQDPLSSCGLFAWGQNTGSAPSGTIHRPMFFSGKPSRTTSPLMASSNSPSYLPPPCGRGCTGRHPNCDCDGKQEFSGYRNGEGDDEKSDGANWSDKIDADTITAGLETAQGIISLFGNKRQLSEVEGACGKQPKFLAGKAKKQAWAQCASDYVKAQIEANKPKRAQSLSTGAWIGIALGASAIIGGAIYFGTRKTAQPQLVMVQPSVKVVK